MSSIYFATYSDWCAIWLINYQEKNLQVFYKKSTLLHGKPVLWEKQIFLARADKDIKVDSDKDCQAFCLEQCH